MDDLANLPERMREISYLLEQGERIPPHEDEHLLGVGATEIERLRVEINRLWALYDELLLQVGNKYPDETRHQTALRYLRKAETFSDEQSDLRAALEEARAEIERLTDNKWSKIELALAEYDAKRLHDKLFKEHHDAGKGE